MSADVSLGEAAQVMISACRAMHHFPNDSPLG